MLEEAGSICDKQKGELLNDPMRAPVPMSMVRG